ncbi:NodT family efflux transporter outer membrane factor (OMF) lipoprotein [Prosthecobacter fusiformis]|uniref:NodT family efflux transporter outer membrane factor (OMF) lipoprotein n=1 Tax=Prosthecobacter fusiformis TaxID=48464 RepID=A0A4R7SR67_9BACT|nr:efflux transporter outer membrane subunit [Prosthecobacter fusiformis]TDU81109.1 NodT family efflux transporter outer membrane factor (OMF) lipoprotein [Prosthecobacter fusiformis]
MIFSSFFRLFMFSKGCRDTLQPGHIHDLCAMNLKILPCLLRCLPSVAAAFFVAACTSVKRHESDLAVPGKWQEKGSSSVPLNTGALAKWWQRFNDPVLNQLIAESLQSSPDLRTAMARIDESRARRGVEKSTLFPSIGTGASGRGERTDSKLAGVSTSEGYGASVDVSWELDLFGKLRQNVRAASADLAQTTENYYGAQVTLAAEVAEAYVDLRAAEAQLEVYQRNLSTRGDTVQITRWREEAGESTTFETQQAASTLEQARATLPTLKQTISQTKNRLALLAGKTPGSLDSMLAKARRIPQPPSMLAIGIPADTLRQRPDVRAAERGVEAAVARTKSAQRERYPTLSLSGSLGVDALKAGSLFSPEVAAASVLGNLSAPIFNAGRITQTINIQSSQEKQALIAYESTVLQALSEVENALIAVNRTAERLSTLNGAVASAKEAATLASQSYEAGQVDLLQVLDTQRTLLSLEEQQTATIGDRASAHIQLYKALGGGWSSQG